MWRNGTIRQGHFTEQREVHAEWFGEHSFPLLTKGKLQY